MADVNVINPSGELVSIPQERLSDAINSGYQQPSEEQTQNLTQQAKYGTPGQMALTALEGFGAGTTFGLSTGAERLGGVPSEVIRERREANPWTYHLSQAGGMATGLLTGTGEGALLAKAGAATAERLGIEGIGGLAARGFVENALTASGDEMSKMLSEDPNQSLQSAVTNIGLSGVIGAGTGALLGSAQDALPKYEGSKLETFINGFKDIINARASGADLPFSASKWSMGQKAAFYLLEKGGSKLAGDLAGTVGGGLLGYGLTGGSMWGGAVGSTLGGVVGQEFLSPFFESVLPAIAKTLAGSPTNPAAFAAATKYASAALRGAELTAKAAKSIFDSELHVLPQVLLPNKKSIEKLDDRLQELQENPEEIMNSTSQFAYYMPNHGPAVGQMAATAINVLNSLRPKQTQALPLDKASEPTTSEQRSFQRALALAEQPLSIVGHIKDGTVAPQDISLVKQLYPDLSKNLGQQVFSQMVDHLSKNKTVPYRTRMGLSMFLGEPLDSTMTPMSIMAAQPQQSQQAMAPRPQRRARSSKALQGASLGIATPMQAREMRRGKDG